MALYQEIYEISKNLPSFNKINLMLENHTGLACEMEELSKYSAVFSNVMLKTEIEVNISDDNQLYIYFLPKKNKNYYEYSFLHILKEYLDTSSIEIPSYAKKKWHNLKFFEKLLKK